MSDTGSPGARLRRLVQLATDPGSGFTVADAVASASTADIAHFLHPHFDGEVPLAPLGIGVPASPGAASGRVALTADAAIDAADRGEAVILVRRETGPEDVMGMQASAGILTARGGLASHAAVVARGWGIPAVVGLRPLEFDGEGLTIEGHRLAEGDVISIDGHTGEVFLGGSSVSTAAPPAEVETILGWADRLRAGHFAVRANADDAESARHARSMGAEGIGLCRTEHMFLADDRLPLVRRLILSDDAETEAAALKSLEQVQELDFEALFEAMDGLPVTVRLLDPPLHEFLPDLERLVVAEALGQLDAEGRSELAAVRRLHEANPMIGTRGVRLGMVKPGLYPMQVRALSRAVASLQKRGLSPRVEVMIPLVVDAAELRLSRGWVEQAEAEIDASGSGLEAISVGTMIETPRAALVAGDLARCADFFSFGTNDLTQMTFAFSRDDVEAELLPRYIDEGLLPANPFEVLDQAGVGFLVRHAIQAARAVNPSIKVGACGEQSGDPASAAFFVRSGLDYVSCSPYRLPVVRLAVAQALLDLGLADASALSGTAPPATPQAAPAAGPPSDGTFRLMHALKIKGFAPADLLAEMAGVPGDWADAELERWLAEELVKFHQARNLWQLTPAGRERHKLLLPGAGPDDLARVRDSYRDFLDLNVAFKELCISWQMRDGVPNDHADSDYDRIKVQELVAHHHVCRPLMEEFSDAIERLGLYLPRLDAALLRVSEGDRDAFTGVMKRSYHDVWMELHEDLLCILAIDRAAEGSF